MCSSLDLTVWSMRKKVLVPLIVAACLLGAAVIITAVPVDGYPVGGTFRYSIFVLPEWLNTTSNYQGSTYGRGIIFWYGWSYKIVEQQLEAANAPLLQVKSGSLAYNQTPMQAFGRGTGPWEVPTSNRIWAYYFISGNSSASGTLFEESFFGPELPHLTHLPYPWQGSGYYVNVNDMIAQYNLTDGNLEIRWEILLCDVQATVNPDSQVFRSGYAECDSTISDVNIHVSNGVPDLIQSGNFSGGVVNAFDLPQNNLTLDSPIDLYSPILISLKGAVAYLAGTGLLFVIVGTVVLYFNRPKAPQSARVNLHGLAN